MDKEYNYYCFKCGKEIKENVCQMIFNKNYNNKHSGYIYEFCHTCFDKISTIIENMGSINKNKVDI